jgi:hypothetical protein
MFVDIKAADSVTFIAPYLDELGMGLVSSACMPVIFASELYGVICVDISLDLIFNDVINFRLGQLSYGFIIDGDGHTLIHRLLPQPTASDTEPLFVDIRALETNDASEQIISSMLKGETQSVTTTGNFVLSRGSSPLQGSESYTKSATYFWTQVPSMNLSVCLVFVDGEVDNFKFSNNSFPPVYFARDMNVTDKTQKGLCSQWTIASSVEKSSVTLAPMSFVDPFQYNILNYSIVGTLVPSMNQIRQYLEGKTEDGGPLAVKPGVREVIAMTYKLEEIWKATTDPDFLGYTLSRYIGTPEGMLRRYPGAALAPEYDPTKRPWYTQAVAAGQKGKITVTLPYLDPTEQIKLTICTTILEGSASGVHSESDPIVGVMSLDVTIRSFYNFVTKQFDPCKTSGTKCIVIDNSGYVIVHPDYMPNSVPNVVEHITRKEPELAMELFQASLLSNETCINFVDITLQSFSEVYVTKDTTLPSGNKVYPVMDSNIFIIVQGSTKPSGKCTCLYRDSPCLPGVSCQCPCYNSIGFDYCIGIPLINTNETRACVPSIALLHVTDVIRPSRDAAVYLADCRPCNVTGLSTTEEDCMDIKTCCWYPENLSSSKCQQCPLMESSSGVIVKISFSVITFNAFVLNLVLFIGGQN